ncbi:MAG: MarR family transcriptional regulator [Bowdeniella nasicola]|nr:MarR family transcriptional regulator [Bowdeniella nasicola]
MSSPGDDVAVALGKLLRRDVRQRLYTRLTDGVADGVSEATYPVLSGLERSGPSTAAELAMFIGLDRSVVSRHATTLEHTGLLTRTPDPRDRRWTALTLTDAGEAAVTVMRQRLTALINEFLADWPAEQTRLLLALLGVGAYISRSLANGLVIRLGTRATVYLFITCTIIGTLPFALPIPHTATWLFVDAAGLIVRGGGIGALTMLTMSALYHQMPAEYIVHASAFSRVATQLGSALGVAICTFLLALTGGVGATTFAYLTLITAFLGATSCALPRGGIRRL